MIRFAAVLAISILPVLTAPGMAKDQPPDLGAIKAEPNLEKRADMAWDLAEWKLKEAEQFYKGGNWEGTSQALQTMAEAAELGNISLEKTGKDARKNYRHYKRGEVRMEKLLHELEDFTATMNVEEQSETKAIRARIRDVHENLLLSVMGVKNH